MSGRRDGPLRVGLVGCGRATETYHLPALERLSDVAVVAAADPDPERLEAVAGALGGVDRYGSHERLLAAGDAEALLVATPPRLHAPVALDVLAAGRHLLLEKPIAVDREGAARLVEAAGEAGPVAFMGFNLRFHPAVPDLRALVSSGALGPVRAVRSVFTTSEGRDAASDGWRATPGEGGGVLHDLAVHHFDLIGHLVKGEPEGVTASVLSGAGGIEEGAAVSARLSSGVVLSGHYARGAADENTLELRCAHGTARLSFYGIDGLRVDPGGKSTITLPGRIRMAARRLARAARGVPALPRGGPFRQSYEREWRSFVDSVRAGRPPDCTLADGARATALALAAEKAADRGSAAGPSDVGRGQRGRSSASGTNTE